MYIAAYSYIKKVVNLFQLSIAGEYLESIVKLKKFGGMKMLRELREPVNKNE